MKNQPRGIVTVLNTPLTANDTIDVAGLRRNVSNAIEEGVAGILVPAMASEVDWLSRDEKDEIVRCVVAEVRQRAIVIGGCSAIIQTERMELAEGFLQLGCDGVLVQVDSNASLQQTERDVAELAALEPEILMLQDWDSNGPGMPVNDIVRLFEKIDRFNWLKIEVAGAGPKYSKVLEATGGKLNVAGGWAVTEMIDGLDRGVDAFMPTAMHHIYVQIYRSHASGDRVAAARLFERIKPVLAFSNQSLDVSIRFFKRMLCTQGVYATDKVRIGGDSFSTDQAQRADELIRLVTKIQSELDQQ